MSMFGECLGCKAKDQTIELLTKQIEGFEKSLLALADVRAAAQRFRPIETQAQPGPPIRLLAQQRSEVWDQRKQEG